jgi:hypothetical protein
MWGEPEDKEGACNARLFIHDNYGDGNATMCCQLAPNHEGLHQEEFSRPGGPVVVTWVADERERCDHGCGQWRTSHNDPNVPCPKDAADHVDAHCAFCSVGETAETCAACGQIYYWQPGHKNVCPKEKKA